MNHKINKVEALLKNFPDCNDNQCKFSTIRNAGRSNTGCRCLKDGGLAISISLQETKQDLLNLISLVRKMDELVSQVKLDPEHDSIQECTKKLFKKHCDCRIKNVGLLRSQILGLKRDVSESMGKIEWKLLK